MFPCRTTKLALGACCEALKTEDLEVEETALAEARKQRNAVLFMSEERVAVGNYRFGPLRMHVVDTAAVVSRSRLFDTATQDTRG
jgi:hypothetical protein